MKEGKSRAALKKLGHMRSNIESLMPGLPSLKGGSGYLKLLGRLALRNTLSLQVEILLE